MAKDDFTGHKGRTYLAGDIHGQYDKFKNKLDSVGFDESNDKLLFCGDLVNRGAQSLKCLRLLNERWFYPVMGNHDYRMLGTYLEHLTGVSDANGYHQALDKMDPDERHFAKKYGAWLFSLSPNGWKELHGIMPALIDVPLSRLAITQQGHRIGVVHNDVWGDDFEAMASLDGSDIRVIDHLIYNRPFVKDVIKSLPDDIRKLKGSRIIRHDTASLARDNGHHSIKGVDLVVHGHTVFESPTLVGNRLYMETGGYRMNGLMSILGADDAVNGNLIKK